MNDWKYKVIKKQRGNDGKWFAYRPALVSADPEAAINHAREFAAEQRTAGVIGTRIVVLAHCKRKCPQLVAEFRVNCGSYADPNAENLYAFQAQLGREVVTVDPNIDVKHAAYLADLREREQLQADEYQDGQRNGF